MSHYPNTTFKSAFSPISVCSSLLRRQNKSTICIITLLHCKLIKMQFIANITYFWIIYLSYGSSWSPNHSLKKDSCAEGSERSSDTAFTQIRKATPREIQWSAKLRLMHFNILILVSTTLTGASQVALVVKNLPAYVGDARFASLIPGSKRSPGKGNGNPFRYSCLENPMDREAEWTTVHGVMKSWTWLTAHTQHRRGLIVRQSQLLIHLDFLLFKHREE